MTQHQKVSNCCKAKIHEHRLIKCDDQGYDCVCGNKKAKYPICEACWNKCTPVEAKEESVNFLQVGKSHCFVCHKTSEPNVMCGPHDTQIATPCTNNCPEEYSKHNPLNKMFENPKPREDMEFVGEDKKEKYTETLFDLLREIIIGNNEGAWGDRIWSQEILERIGRLEGRHLHKDCELK